jgi:hypothetical protein
MKKIKILSGFYGGSWQLSCGRGIVWSFLIISVVCGIVCGGWPVCRGRQWFRGG